MSPGKSNKCDGRDFHIMLGLCNRVYGMPRCTYRSNSQLAVSKSHRSVLLTVHPRQIVNTHKKSGISIKNINLVQAKHELLRMLSSTHFITRLCPLALSVYRNQHLSADQLWCIFVLYVINRCIDSLMAFHYRFTPKTQINGNIENFEAVSFGNFLKIFIFQ